MSTIKLGINGFGRIGRLVFRAAMEKENIEVLAINDLVEVDYLAYLLKYDSTHGRFKGKVEVREQILYVNEKPIRVTAEKDPAKINWREVGVEYVAESTGFFLTQKDAQGHLDAGAKKV